jgi:hypothetical protein
LSQENHLKFLILYPRSLFSLFYLNVYNLYIPFLKIFENILRSIVYMKERKIHQSNLLFDEFDELYLRLSVNLPGVSEDFVVFLYCL